MRNRWIVPLMSVLVLLVASLGAAQETADEPSAVVAATDTKTLKERIGKEVVVVGKVASAQWSKSGKVMDVLFEGAPEGDFAVILFERNRKTFDAAFSGDVAKTLTGAEVRIRGVVSQYNGSVEAMKGRLEVAMTQSSQITITVPAAK